MLTKKEKYILKSIKVASDNDPLNPEFPADNPKFPATPTYKIEVPGFSNVWLKDESFNPTGTHKDRMAWEIVVTYRDFLISKKNNKINKLPKVSIISSGSAAIAIQTQLKKYKLPNLKVLIDKKTKKTIVDVLKNIGCEVYKTDLSKKILEPKDILMLTKNINGIDVTSSEALDPTTRFYDWLSYEIINNSPEYCFIPFGTGNLYENILNINKKEVTAKIHDPRFSGSIKILSGCNFIGATTNSPKSKAAEKLYSPHLPFKHYDEQWIKLYKLAGYCGQESNVYNLKEKYIDEAIKIINKQNINSESSGLSGLAMLLQLKDKIKKDAKIIIINTGKTKM